MPDGDLFAPESLDPMPRSEPDPRAVLHDVFGYPFDEIASMVWTTWS